MKTAIFYFSGTGNTEYVCHCLKTSFEKIEIQCDLFNIEPFMKSEPLPNIEGFDQIGLAYPVHGFGTPTYIEEFIGKLPVTDQKPLFLIHTGAMNGAMNSAVGTAPINQLSAQGYKPYYQRIVIMPIYWITSGKKSLNHALHAVVPAKTDHMAGEIRSQTHRLISVDLKKRKLTQWIHRMEETKGGPGFGKSLKTTGSCTLCGICVRNCPSANISEKNNQICFGSNCIWCMRCIYDCPEKAIKSSKMAFCIVKKDYPYKRKDLRDQNGEDLLSEENIMHLPKSMRSYFRDSSL